MTTGIGGLPSLIDGSWVDIGSALFSIGAGIIRVWRCRTTQKPIDRNVVISDGMNAAALFPFFVMMGMVISSRMAVAVTQARKFSFFLAAWVGVLWVVGELSK